MNIITFVFIFAICFFVGVGLARVLRLLWEFIIFKKDKKMSCWKSKHKKDK